MSGVDLREADLDKVDLREANLNGALLSKKFPEQAPLPEGDRGKGDLKKSVEAQKWKSRRATIEDDSAA
ncbi:hypothetical protein KSC_051510 [Ktedonobacter sp. SOSP1-52]|uniref:pentapeptide repeat-containing protein n=1 Tax=Ktedonobacter sp. SOSP1-52 TaxID=2778366 RepID=UPI00191626CA|nr:pentapeptide repeat-containing protein [Ktedonobacter sp. SOSP1-52]GHO66259.1 hypothetical protein KSC_051510 [Ktedonobacter sp. SOSP1-52]